MKKTIRLFLAVSLLLVSGLVLAQDHLVISEIVVTPTGGEFFEIYNPTSQTVDLTNYYVTDGIFSGDPHPDYVNIVDSTDTPFSSDFLARFPAGASIGPGEYKVVALNNNFSATYGFDPDFEMNGNGVDDGDAIPDMLNGGSGIGGNPGLSNDGEVVILFFWDGVSDLVQDVDIALWGDKAEAVDKTGVKKDSKTDADADSTEYQPDTPIANQSVIASGPHASGNSWQRIDPTTEVGETTAGGNGKTGHDETSENVATAFTEDAATPGAKLSQTVNVTFRVNTATNLDTLSENHVVQIRGALLAGDGTTTREGNILPGGGNISWSSASSLILQNVGGDYWSGTFELNADDTLTYKFWTGFDLQNGTSPDGGWEGPFNPSHGLTRDTRIFIVGNSDTTVDLQYYHPAGPSVDQFFRPFESKPDTIGIYFRVNMAGVTEAEQFDPAVNGPVGVRGDDVASGGVLNWGTTNVLLTREVNNVKDDPFWSGVAYIPKSAVTAGSIQAYKFFVEGANTAAGDIDWESGDNRTFVYTSTLVSNSDTTLHWVYFDRRKPTGKVLVDANVTFRVSTEALEDLGLFDSALGDSIHVIGPKGWDVTVGQPTSFIRMNFNPLLGEWTASEPFRKFPGDQIIFKYFVRWDLSRVDPNSPNYIPNLVIRGANDPNNDSGWEEPGITGGADRRYTYTSDAIQAIPGDFGFDRNFFNSIPGNGVIKTPITITWNVNMAPATDPATNPNTHLFTPGTDSVWIQPDGSLFALSQGFPTVGALMVLLTDEDSDMIYSGSFTTTKPAPYQIEYVVAYGTTGNIVTNGQSVQFGRRYYQFVHPTNIANDLTTTWPAEFTLPTVDWKAGVSFGAPLPVETPPDLTKPTSVAEKDDGIPRTFALEQNYPNPFNPETTIRYQVAKPSDVKIQVYNLVGQLVKTLLDEKQNQGNYTIQWHGDNDKGQIVSSGVYFLKMQAGDFAQVRKMVFIR